jgi:hypothetical protein
MHVGETIRTRVVRVCEKTRAHPYVQFAFLLRSRQVPFAYLPIAPREKFVSDRSDRGETKFDLGNAIWHGQDSARRGECVIGRKSHVENVHDDTGRKPSLLCVSFHCPSPFCDNS